MRLKIIGTRPLNKQGGSYLISLDMGWLRRNQDKHKWRFVTMSRDVTGLLTIRAGKYAHAKPRKMNQQGNSYLVAVDRFWLHATEEKHEYDSLSMAVDVDTGNLVLSPSNEYDVEILSDSQEE